MLTATNRVQDTEAPGSGELRHSQELAQLLVRHLGIKGATRTCIENHWQGVLSVVRSMTPPA